MVVGPSRFDPVLAVSSPPVGAGLETGRRQTTVPLEPGSVVCLHTDGLTEARTEGGGIIGRGRICDLLDRLGRMGAAILQVRFGTRGPQAEVLPANVESLGAAARSARSATAV